MSGKVLAVETEIVVAPAIIDAPVEVGKSISKSIEIRNGSDTALPISIEVQSAQTGAEFIDEVDKSRFNVANWVDFSSSTYVFAPGESRRIHFSVTAPFTAQAGGYYAQISVRSLSLEQNIGSQTGALVFPEIAVPLLVTVPGEVEEKVLVGERIDIPRFISPHKTITTEIPIENRGTIHDRIQARLVIQKDDGTMYVFEIDPLFLYPYTKKSVPIEWSVNSFGRYTAFIELTYGSRNKLFTTEPKRITSIPPPISLFKLAIGVWAATYLTRHRFNILGAIKVIVKGH
jgi:hypothetical protein